jgi:hypothetical protein
MNTVSIVLLVIAACASLVGTLVMLKSFRASPEGFEDAAGFHYGRPQGAQVREMAHARVLEHQSAA